MTGGKSVSNMLGNSLFVLDRTCEIFDLLEPWAHDVFHNFSTHEVNTNAIYVLSRIQFLTNKEKIRDLVENHNVKFIFGNPFEGSSTFVQQLVSNGLDDLVKNKKILVVAGGKMDNTWPHLQYEFFLSKMYDFNKNQIAFARSNEIYDQITKPFKFLFLNGRGRPHRKWLVERLDVAGLLDQCIWSWLDPSAGFSKMLRLKINGQDLMGRPRKIHLLEPKYEIEEYCTQLNLDDCAPGKYDLFDGQWGEIHVQAEPYIDTYFSLVTETVFDYPYSFRTEKIWKPIAMGHPWIVAANTGFVKDIRNLGFKTFDSLLDESYDQIDDNQHRLQRVAQVVEDLCQQNLDLFLESAKDICKYNQQHLVSLIDPIKKQFPDQFFKFLQDHQWTT